MTRMVHNILSQFQQNAKTALVVVVVGGGGGGGG